MAIEVLVPGVPEPILVEVVGLQGRSAYDSYAATTGDDPVLSEAAWVESLGGGGGVGTVVDAVTNGNANAVSSNAVFDAINALSFAGSDPNKSRMVITGTSYPAWANQTLIYAGLYNSKPSWTTDGLSVFGASFEGRMMLYYSSTAWAIDSSSAGEGEWEVYSAYATSAADFPDEEAFLLSLGTGNPTVTAEALPANFLGQWCKSSAALWQWNGTAWEAWAEDAIPTPTSLGALITWTAVEDTAPLNTDFLPMTETAASGVLRKLTFANLWTWIKLQFTNNVSAITTGGAWSFTSTTNRPTSAGTGTPAATSLITRADGDARYGQEYIQIISTAVQAFSTAFVNGPDLVLPAGTYDFELFGFLEIVGETSGGDLNFRCSPSTDVTTAVETRLSNIGALGTGSTASTSFRKGTVLNLADHLGTTFASAPNNYGSVQTRGTTVLASETTLSFRVKQRVADAVNPATLAVGSFIKFTKR